MRAGRADSMGEIWVSILGCDSMEYGQSIEKMIEGGADSIHIDVMDGVYVRNLAFFPRIVSDIKNRFDISVDVHLELLHPENYVDMFIDAGADAVAFQAGTTQNQIRLLQSIKARGVRAGIGLNLADGLDKINYVKEYLDYVILLSVEPGFGGAHFESTVYERIKESAKLFKEDVPLVVDGCVGEENIAQLSTCGASCFIVGTAISDAVDTLGSMAVLREKIKNTKKGRVKT